MIEGLVIIILMALNAWQWVQRIIAHDEYKAKVGAESGKRALAEQQLETLKDMLSRKALTVKAERAQTLPKPMSGPALRRLNEQLNNQDTAALQERPNSEILKENSNG